MNMRFPSTAHRLAAIALFAMSGTVYAADAAAEAKSAAAAAKEKSKKTVTSAADLKKLFEEASKQRDALIADYEKLAKQLKDATEEQRAAIKEKMEGQKRNFEEVMNALHAQIRDEQRKQRQDAAKR